MTEEIAGFEVIWIDCAYTTEGVYTDEELRDYTYIEMKTIGYGCDMGVRFVLVAEEQASNYRHLFAIPKVCIFKINKLSEEG